MDSAQRLKRDESRHYRSRHVRLLTIQQQIYEVFLEIFILRHVQLTADMCTHYADILVCLVEQLSYLGHCLTLKDKVAHINLCLSEHGKDARDVVVVHKVILQVLTHGVYEVVLRFRLEHGKQAVGVLGRQLVGVAYAQICLYLPLVQSDGVHQCRIALMQVGILLLHVRHVVVQQFT